MTDAEKANIKGDALLEFHEAVNETAANRARFGKLTEVLRSIAVAIDDDRLLVKNINGSDELHIKRQDGLSSRVDLPTKDAIITAVQEHSAAKVNETEAKRRCQALGLNTSIISVSAD